MPDAYFATCLVDYKTMAKDMQGVLDSLNIMRLQPYRTLEHVIEGVVISFIDITEQKKAVRDAQDLNSHNLKS